MGPQLRFEQIYFWLQLLQLDALSSLFQISGYTSQSVADGRFAVTMYIGFSCVLISVISFYRNKYLVAIKFWWRIN